MAKEMSEINMEELSCLILKHEITWMSISNSKNVSSNTLSCQRVQEVHVIIVETPSDLFHFWSESELISSADFIQHIFHHSCLIKCTSPETHGVPTFSTFRFLITPFVPVHPCDNLCIIDEFNISCLISRLHYFITYHLHLHTAGLPQSIHDFKELEYQIVLS